jgi:hypothetical protein
MKTLTPQQIVDLKPCRGYNLQQVTELFDNKKSLTYLEILDTDKIPLEDIIWVFCQFTMLDDDIRNQWLEVIVTRAVTNHALHCGVDDVEKWAKNWLSGDNRTAVAARAAAEAAADAYATAEAAAYAAAEAAADAARYAANAASNYTAIYAAHAASTDADTYNAIRETEYKQQVQDLKKLLKEDK